MTERFIVFQSFGQHGRELITSEVALNLLYILTEKRKIAGVDLSSFEKILENLVIKVVPMENLNGRKRVEEGELCDRRNGRGVDLNRNWSVDWGKKEKVVFSAVYFMHRENCFLLTYCSVHVDFTELRLKLIT